MDDFRIFDIEPYIIRDEICSIKNEFSFGDFPYCVLVEGIDSESRKSIDNRLKSDLDYVGCTSISYVTKDIRKNFKDMLICDMALENGVLYYADSKEN